MHIDELRKKHPVFTYKSFQLQQKKAELIITFHFTIGQDIEFKPQVIIPLQQAVQGQALHIASEQANLVFNLGMIEAISYWKLTCSPQFIIEAGYLNSDQISWWHNLYMHGLGEFFYKNQIDFSGNDFLTVSCSSNALHISHIPPKKLEGDLILAGGGKDSAVMFEVLKEIHQNKQVMLLNPMDASAKITEVAGFKTPIVVKRSLDPKLLDLNKKGYLNGHTPFSAYVAFLGTFIAYIYGYSHVIVANEASASEASLTFCEMEINHQYSKSWHFENAFRQYVKKYLSSQVTYFSLLRPLTELQAAALFAHTEKYDATFCSCNVSRNTIWCMQCAKCAFVYLVLSPFLSDVRLHQIFGDKNYFDSPEIQKHLIDTIGLGEYKPLECVGTIEESRLSVALTIFKYKRLNLPIPDFLVRLDGKLSLTSNTTEEIVLKQLHTDWNENHFLPNEYEKVLKKQLNKI